MKKNNPSVLVFLENDLRLTDNPAIFDALKFNLPILFSYCFDEKSKTLRKMNMNKKWWLKESLNNLDKKLNEYDQKIYFFEGSKISFLEKIISQVDLKMVNFNDNTDPLINELNQNTINFLKKHNIPVQTFLSATLFDPTKILNKQESPYKVFTSFWNECKKQNFNLKNTPLIPTPKFKNVHIFNQKLNCNFSDINNLTTKNIQNILELKNMWKPGENEAKNKLKKFMTKIQAYSETRNKPSIKGTSELSPHIYFGEISVKYIFNEVLKHFNIEVVECFLKELIWREFSTYLLFHFPELVNESFQKKFNTFKWEKNDDYFQLWAQGLTGYPIVDAGMRQLQQTGWIHNRVRMIVASFLTKDLLINWKQGEEFFWSNLIDGDTCSNIINWQWVAGCGVDPSPFFRIFNPTLQGKKFDPTGDYIKKYLPELQNLPTKYIHSPWLTPTKILTSLNIKLDQTYPLPIIDHEKQRQKALKLFKKN